MATKSKILITELYPKIEKGFSDKNNIKKYENALGSYIDKYSETLSAIGPTKKTLFTERDRLPVFQIIESTELEVKSIKSKVKNIPFANEVLDFPFNTVMALAIRYFSLTKDEKFLKNSILYLGLSMYPLIFAASFPYEPNENVMNYTINNLSNRFNIKKTGNLMMTIMDTAYGAYELHKKGIEEGNDADIVQFVLAVRTRLKALLKKIANEFYKNHEEGKYLNTELEINEDDKFREADSSTYLVNRLTDNVSLKLIIEGPPIKLINAAAKSNQVSVNELRNQVTSMVTNKHKDEIKKIIESILFLYLFDKQNTAEEINSDKFLVYCLDIYKRSNTTDENIINIKKILDAWLDELGVYKKTQRLATINSFRKAMFTFFVMSIMYFNT